MTKRRYYSMFRNRGYGAAESWRMALGAVELTDLQTFDYQLDYDTCNCDSEKPCPQSFTVLVYSRHNDGRKPHQSKWFYALGSVCVESDSDPYLFEVACGMVADLLREFYAQPCTISDEATRCSSNAFTRCKRR